MKITKMIGMIMTKMMTMSMTKMITMSMTKMISMVTITFFSPDLHHSSAPQYCTGLAQGQVEVGGRNLIT